MEVLILGSGQVGAETAKALVKNRCNVTVVDNNRQKLLDLQALYDLRTVCGNAADPAVLRRAGGDNAELVIAVTAIDEVNLVACRMCSLLFSTPKKIARLRSSALNSTEIASADGFNISHIFCPEQIIADTVCSIIKHPGCLSVHKFSATEVVLAAIRVTAGGEMTGETISKIRESRPDIDFRVVAVYRDNRLQQADAATRLFVGDEASVVIAENDLDTLIPLLSESGANDNILIAGGGNIGERVAREAEKNSQVKIIDLSHEKCAQLSARLKETLVLKGSASDENMLREENIADTDVYCALTNDDEENILSAMLAKRLGAKKTIVLVNRPAYADILARLLDNVVSPAELSIGAILTHIRAGDIGAVHSLHQGAAEVIEAVIHGNEKTSPVVGRAVAKIKWPTGAVPGAVVRNERIIIAHDRTVLQDGDRIIIFVSGGKTMRQVEKLLQVNIGYF